MTILTKVYPISRKIPWFIMSLKNKSRLKILLLLPIYVLSVTACEELKGLSPSQGEVRDFDPLKLQEPDEQASSHKKVAAGACQVRPKAIAWPTSARIKEALEPGEAVFLEGDAYALSSLVSGARNRSEIAYFSSGGSRVIPLGATLGQSAPAQLAWRGQRLYFAHFSSNAGHFIARLGEVHNISNDPQIHWKARIQQGRDTSLVSDLAVSHSGAVLVWDEPLPGSARSQVKGYWLRPELKKNEAKEVQGIRLSEADEDADSPQLVPNQSGFYLGYLSYPPQRISERGSGLVQEPLSQLKISSLSAQGGLRDKAVTINDEPLRIMGFDMRGSADKAEVIYWYLSKKGVLFLQSARINASGVLQKEQIEVNFPSLGSFALFGSQQDDASAATWVLGPSNDSSAYLSFISDGVPSPFILQSALRGTFPIIRNKGELVLAHPVGLNFELKIADCEPQLGASDLKSLKK